MNMKDMSKTDKKELPLEVDAHRAIVLWLFLATLVITIFASAILIYSDLTQQKVVSILPVVVVAGVLGSFVSALNRIYSASNVFPTYRYSELLRGVNWYLIAYSSIPALVGAISATILYVVFASEIIVGPFFPAFSCSAEKGECTEFLSFLSHWSPTGATDYAKAIVWGFFSGFSERYVPDILNRVANKSTDDA